VRFGGSVFGDWAGPDEWARLVRQHGYSAAYCPVDETADDGTVAAFRRAAEEADIVIAEVGAWSNPISPDDDTRREALDLCRKRLALADRIGARCCVNIAGSRAEQWDGPDPENLSPETFDLIVQTVRTIVDEVQPARTFYALETMPWVFPNSADSYAELVRAIDRDAFAVHLDPVNLVWSPQRYFANAELIRECFAKLGPHIRSVHAKDVALSGELTVHLDEVRPGQGALDYPTLLLEMDGLGTDVPLMLEHLPSAQEYEAAAAHVRSVAAELGVRLA